jgi:hypothetical protein
MSAQTYNLLHEIPDMLKMGIDIIRISPQKAHQRNHRRFRRRTTRRAGRTPTAKTGIPAAWSMATGSATPASFSAIRKPLHKWEHEHEFEFHHPQIPPARLCCQHFRPKVAAMAARSFWSPA